MKLQVKEVNLSTGGPLVAILHEKTAKKLNLYPADRLIVRRLKIKGETTCVINISSKGVREDQIGLFDEVIKKLGLAHGTQVEVERAEKPYSTHYIRKKLDGGELSETEINEIIKDVVANELSEAELTYFVSGCYTRGLSLRETVHLTNAIVNNGERLQFKDKIIIDKHCIGGVPGNRTTMVVIPIIASLGYKMPKTSSRAITSASGTADTVELLAPVTFSKKKIQQIVNKTNGCMVWGGAVNLAGADDKLIKIRHPLSIDPTGMMLASIMAKKKAAGATHVLIDIPVGKGAKIENRRDARRLRKLFIKTGRMLGMKVRVVLTDGSHPIGNGIGPALEVTDVIGVLKGDGPSDLREKAIYMATEILKLVGERNPKEKVVDALDSGRAYQKFREIIVAQGGLKRPIIPRAQFFWNVKADHDGHVKEIRNKAIADIARLAGAPEEKTAGLYLRVHVFDEVHEGMTLFTVYSSSWQDIEIVKRRLKELHPIIY